MEDNRLYSVIWLCIVVMFCAAVFSIKSCSVQEIERDKEYAKQGLHQQVQAGGFVIWVK